MFFKHPKAIPKLKLTINDNPIEQVTELNFLGITIDQNVTWNAHITKTSIKIARVTAILPKLKHSFPQRILLIDSSTFNLWPLPLGIESKTVNYIAKESFENPSPSTLSISLKSSVQISKNS